MNLFCVHSHSVQWKICGLRLSHGSKFSSWEEKKSRNKAKSIILVDSLLLNKIAVIYWKVILVNLNALSQSLFPSYSLVTTRWVAVQNSSSLLHDVCCVYWLHGRYNVLIKEWPDLFRFHNIERHTLNYMTAYGGFHISFHIIF